MPIVSERRFWGSSRSWLFPAMIIGSMSQVAPMQNILDISTEAHAISWNSQVGDTQHLVPIEPLVPVPALKKDCRNSYDPACGSFYWDPQPVNSPLSVEVAVVDVQSRSNSEYVVDFRVSVTDPDARINRDCYLADYGDGDLEGCLAKTGCRRGPQAYGPWSPSPKTPDTFETLARHVYRQPGQYVAEFKFRSLPPTPDCSPPDPYFSEGSGSGVVELK